MYKDVHFVRHAESVTNARGTWLDTATNPLTDKGRKEAVMVSEVLSGTPDLIVTSPYIRTLQTAEPFLEKHPDVRHEEWQVQEFNQICHVRHGLLTFLERRAMINKNWEQEDPDYQDGPKAESFNAMIKRVDHTLAKVFDADFQFAVIFTHGFFLSALMYRVANRKENPVPMLKVRDHKRAYAIPNTAIIRCRFYDSGEIDVGEMDFAHLGPNPNRDSVDAK